MPRLPLPGSDEGTWGTILNDYLSVVHQPNGTLKDDAVTGSTIASNTIPESALDPTVQSKLNSGGGTPGATGAPGLPGATGAQGTQGPAGTTGSQGPTGQTGATGAQGAQGTQGPAGTPGQPGATGAQGTQGTPGATGPQGDQGDPGTPGATGAQGPAGTNGTDGQDGATGPQGTPGTQGATGAQGTAGATGPAGTNGTDGQDGTTGATGPQGATGPAGQDGTDGTDGTSVTIAGSVSTAANLPTGLGPGDAGQGYITEDNGHLHVWSGTAWTDVGEIRGPQGQTGATGPQGTAGTNGATGATGAQGAVGATGAAGTTSWSGITDKPAVIAAGADMQAARTAIDALPVKNGTSALTDSTNDRFAQVDISDDASPTAGWTDRLAFYFSGVRTGYHNEYGELRARPAKVNTVALRAMKWSGTSTQDIFQVTNADASVTYFNVGPTAIAASIPVNTTADISTTGTVTGSNIGAKVVVIANGGSVPGGTPAGSVIIELEA